MMNENEKKLLRSQIKTALAEKQQLDLYIILKHGAIFIKVPFSQSGPSNSKQGHIYNNNRYDD